MNLINTILDIFFPIDCICCKKNGKYLCSECLLSFPPVKQEGEKWIFSLYDYRHPLVKKSLWLLKYKGRKQIANIFAEVMYGIILEELSDFALIENFREPILIPIPLTKKKQRRRGFNQAQLIAERLVKLDDNKNFVLNTDILVKSVETKQQANIKDKKGRLHNLADSFAVVNTKKIKDKNIILIDDITTTGTTLKEAKKALKKAGAKKFIAFTVAH
jgi:competence protein ComFC